MYQQVESRLVVTTTTDVVSDPLNMEGANAVFVEITTFADPSTGGLDVTLQLSNDLENWEDEPTTPPSKNVTGVTYDTFKATNVAAKYVRLFFDNKGTATTVVAAGINTANL